MNAPSPMECPRAASFPTLPAETTATPRARTATGTPIGRIIALLVALGVLAAGALLTLSVVETTEYDRDAFSIAP